MSKFRLALIISIISILVLILTGIIWYKYFLSIPQSVQFPNTRTVSKDNNVKTSAREDLANATEETIATGLTVPWEIAVLPTGDLLVTQRTGEIVKIGTSTKIISSIKGVHHEGEGGLLGLALHPDFSTNNFVYIYLTAKVNDVIENRVERYSLENDTLVNRKVILEGIKGASNHDGGRIAFGPDGFLYITTGDAEDEMTAQDKNSLNGKILRITDNGSIPKDNPFNNAVYSIGHRNPQGLAWDDKGRLWASEHGPSGLGSGFDEINLVEKGANYGWPLIKGEETRQGLKSPILQSGASDTWAPADLAYYKGSLYFSGLRGSTLYKLNISNLEELNLEVFFKDEFGRLRAVVESNGALFISTSNRDGRGIPKVNDDKILKFSL
jgi:glucose/arabinose dehydrogenase